MADYTELKYDKYRNWVKQAREKGKEWDSVKLGLKNDEQSLCDFLNLMRENAFWDIDLNDWYEIVKLQKSTEEASEEFERIAGSTILLDKNIEGSLSVPDGENTSWQTYRRKLRKNGFQLSSIDEIERSTLKLLNSITLDSVKNGVRKGLVMGNVQSGKTANMAALMAMAGDWGWNVFIILSGTIENLRKQTQKRLVEDLAEDGCTLQWKGLENLSLKCSEIDKPKALNLTGTSRYFTVCLKNKKRLENLTDWMQMDPKKKQQMKVLVIDDEADQAGINTADVNSEQRRAINKLIVNLVEDKTKEGKKKSAVVRAMNYIGYTATPYANFLNEASEESLYPRNFIMSLVNPPEYFGPQSIFGIEGFGDEAIPYDGMDIVRTITKNELDGVVNLHHGASYALPDSLKEAVAWFLSSTAALRLSHFKKPLSMLVHTSQKQSHHANVAKEIERWISGNPNEVMKYCEAVWKRETELFDSEQFLSAKPNYPYMDNLKDFPDFDSLKDELRELTSEITHIPLDDEQIPDYHENIHLCIDNCAQNGIDDEGMMRRLVYPESDQLSKMSKAPAFIVVGGATLSRGLTIEGLVSTYFLRSVAQSDTLMQMGRWFGYRRGYELYPRIWLTEKSNDQFRFLSTLDFELRTEIIEMASRGVSPLEYGPKIKNSPMVKFIRITAKNRMQRAVETDLDYSGSHNQTVLFKNDYDVQSQNLSVAASFINSLGKPVESDSGSAFVWRGVDYKRIFDQMLESFSFHENARVFNDVKTLHQWTKQVTEEGKLGAWNVVVAGVGRDTESEPWQLDAFSVKKIKRTRRSSYEDTIDIGVLRTPKDVSADIDFSKLTHNEKEALSKIKHSDVYTRRRVGKLESTPQLLIYRIDKDSGVSVKQRENESNTRQDLNAVQDIIGLCITIPGARTSENYATKVTINLDKIRRYNESDIGEEEGAYVD